MSTAILLVDLQNDFVHPDGAYGRAGVSAPAIAALPGRLRPLVERARAVGAPVIATQFTLVQGPDGPLISEHLARMRPFLGSGDFAPGTWGHAVVDELAPVDIGVEKVAYSAFHASRLEFVLDRLGVGDVIVAGIVTNGGVESTVRHAHVLDIATVVVSDGCAAFSADAHDAALASMATITTIDTVAGVTGRL
ncbi:MAG: cysteine hydrolase family protein [Ilumatobacteraceae bacterium]